MRDLLRFSVACGRRSIRKRSALSSLRLLPEYLVVSLRSNPFSRSPASGQRRHECFFHPIFLLGHLFSFFS